MSESDDLYVGTEFSADQGTSETLTGDNTQDPLDAGYNPPDRPNKSWRGETADEELAGETLDDKLAEEEPDVSEADLEGAFAEERTGRLVAPDEGAHPDEESDEIATDVGRAGYAATAEEAAMHVVDEDLEGGS
jgi:uncharacterized protein DUF5709